MFNNKGVSHFFSYHKTGKNDLPYPFIRMCLYDTKKSVFLLIKCRHCMNYYVLLY